MNSTASGLRPSLYAPVPPERRDFVRLAVVYNADRAVRRACVVCAQVRKDGAGLRRHGAGRNVVIVRRRAAQHIPHRAAHDVGAVAARLQPRQQYTRAAVEFFAHGQSPFAFIIEWFFA